MLVQKLYRPGGVALCLSLLAIPALLTPASAACASPSAVVPMGETMKAVRLSAYGTPDVLKIEDVERPVPKAGEVLVKVAAAGVNPVDRLIREGKARGMTPPPPTTIGYDIAGTVEQVGEGVTEFRKGDEVFAYLSLQRGGGYAEYAIALTKELAKKPAHTDFVAAGGVPLAGLTAWQALVDKAKVQSGQTVLIHGAAGGVGHLAVQIAKARGATVIGTASESNLDYLKEIGCDQVVNYKTQRFEDVAKGVDVVLDTVGGETLERSYGVVKAGGIIVSLVAAPSQAKCEASKIRGVNMLVRPDGAELGEIATLIDEGKIRPTVGATFPLAEAAKAHERGEGGHARGKTVLVVK